jgi:rhodanese-related sulfurtransferase
MVYFLRDVNYLEKCAFSLFYEVYFHYLSLSGILFEPFRSYTCRRQVTVYIELNIATGKRGGQLMRLKLWTSLTTLLVLLALLLSMPLLTACGNGEETEPTTSTPAPTTQEPAPQVSEFDVVKDAVADYLGDMAQHIKASDIQMRIAEGDSPYIVSIRSADNHAAGHIPGAINIAFSELNTLPKDEEILLYCDSGQVASFGSVVLGIQGYDVNNLKHGIAGWTSDPSVATSQFNPEKHQSNFQTETTVNAGGSYDYTEIENTTSTDADAIIKAAAATVSSKFILATDLNMKIAEGEDMTILDIRKADYYTAGHIPGAINFGISSLVDNLNKLNPDAPVYVYCDTGHWAAEAVALLQMLGYDAYSLKFGICSWSPDKAINNGLCYDASSIQNYKIEK